MHSLRFGHLAAQRNQFSSVFLSKRASTTYRFIDHSSFQGFCYPNRRFRCSAEKMGLCAGHRVPFPCFSALYSTCLEVVFRADDAVPRVNSLVSRRHFVFIRQNTLHRRKPTRAAMRPSVTPCAKWRYRKYTSRFRSRHPYRRDSPASRYPPKAARNRATFRRKGSISVIMSNNAARVSVSSVVSCSAGDILPNSVFCACTPKSSRRCMRTRSGREQSCTMANASSADGTQADPPAHSAARQHSL